jgi:hypothetical protein
VVIRRGLLPLALLAGCLGPALGAPFQNATVRRIIDGRQVFIDSQPARVNQTAGRGQQVRTGSSRTELLFDRRAIGFLGRNSLITLGQDCFRLSSGTVLVNGPQSTCLGSKVLGVRGTTYVLSASDQGGYELSVLTGEAVLANSPAEVADPGNGEGSVDILSRYPRLSPVIGFGSSAWGSNAGGKTLGEAAGLILGDLGFFTPLLQNGGSSLLYSYSTGSSNFDGFWGLSSELGYTWFDPNNRSSSTLLLGYDGWQQPAGDALSSCFHSQIAVGGQWQKNRWQFSANGGIPVDRCDNNLGFAMAQVGIPIVDLGNDSIHLSLAPYVMHAIGNSYGGGRIGLNVPIGNQLNLSAYGQYDDLLNSVVGGQISYRFATAGRFVRDPNLPAPGQRSPVPWQNQAFNGGQPMQLALGMQGQSDTHSPLLSQNDPSNPSVVRAGESARFDASGNLISREPLSRERYEQLLINNLEGQNLLPESHAIATTYERLYRSSTPAVLAVTGVDWLIAARTPFPRLRASNNLVVPEDKVSKDSNGRAKTEPANDDNNQNNNPTPDNNPPAPETTVTYVCFSSSVGRYWSSSVTGGVTNIALATRRTASSDAARDCSGLTVGMTFMSSTSPVNVSS